VVTPTGVNAVTRIYATNPAARTITVHVSDQIYNGTDQSVALGAPATADVDVPANSANLLVLTHSAPLDPTQINPPNGGIVVGLYLNDVATATYTDKATGIPVPGQTTAVAQAQITQGTISNTSADISDSESITGAGLTFSVDQPTSGFLNNYVAGTQTTGPVDWLAARRRVAGR
jgi:hypothetical protein